MQLNSILSISYKQFVFESRRSSATAANLVCRAPRRHDNMAVVGFERQRKWTRLSQMTWGEVRTRVGQEVSKRVDLALYRAGLASRAPRLRLQPINRAKFFFATNEGG